MTKRQAFSANLAAAPHTNPKHEREPSRSRFRFVWRSGRTALGLLVVLLLAAPAFAYDEVVTAVMYRDPDPPRPPRAPYFQKELLPLWLKALARPEADMKRLAAASIIEARRRGMPGLEAAVAPLLQAFDQPGQHPTVRLAVAQALVALDARGAAEPLFRASQSGIDLRNVIEPALARWDHPPARQAWLERIAQPAEPRQSLMLALRGLGQVREPRAADRLRELALAPTADPMIRLEAARALAVIRPKGSEKDAGPLLESREVLPRLVAATLLRHHRGDAAVALLKRLAQDVEPAVANVALEALYEADPCLVAALARAVSSSPDANVRAHAVEAVWICPALDHVPLLADLTNDPDPRVRTDARKALRELARRPGYDGPVRREAVRVLATANWRALEQAVILLTQLGHKPAGARFVELLRFDRPEVFVTAAWGLRELALPEHLPALRQAVEWRLTQAPRAGSTARAMAMDSQVARLCEALGRARYRPAEPLLRGFVPRNGKNAGNESRAAAIWALGFLHENAGPPELVEELIGRMRDMQSLNPEDWRVGQMSAASLGRMKAKEAVGILRTFYSGTLSESTVANVAGWALQQITGEPLTPGQPLPEAQRGWFLEPVGE